MSAARPPEGTRRVGILMYDEVEALDFAGPYEVFTTATRMQARLAPTAAAPFGVLTVSRRGARVKARAGMVVQVDHSFADAPAFDVLLVPGGVVDAALACPETLAWIARVAPGCEIVASICTGAFLLAAAGVTGGAPLTTHWEDLADLRAGWPALTVVDGVRWVEHGRLISSAGIAAGIDMSLHLVERLIGRALAERTARQMEVRWLDTP
ncbi:MAG TPA: DJ-1/PfpI family protein [Burkholderiaceae bacterium]|jgi:transcriptional regulator GlxA family with amidase domain